MSAAGDGEVQQQAAVEKIVLDISLACEDVSPAAHVASQAWVRAVLEEACAFFRAAAALADGEPSGGGGGGAAADPFTEPFVTLLLLPLLTSPASGDAAALADDGPAAQNWVGGEARLQLELRADLHATITKLSARTPTAEAAPLAAAAAEGFEAQPMDDESPGAADAAAAWAAATSGEAAASPAARSSNGPPQSTAQSPRMGASSSRSPTASAAAAAPRRQHARPTARRRQWRARWWRRVSLRSRSS